MKINKIRIQNYSIHKDSNVKLSSITLLLGPMGSGKSALFEALISFSQVSRGGLDKAFGHYPYSYGATVSAGVPNTSRMIFNADIQITTERSIEYKISFCQQGNITQGGSLVIGSEVLKEPNGDILFDRDDVEQNTLFEPEKFSGGYQTAFSVLRRRAGDNLAVGNELSDISSAISRMHKFRLEPSALSAPAPIPDSTVPGGRPTDVPHVEYNGYGLCSVLAHLSEGSPEIYQEIIDSCREMDPSIEGFFFDYVGDNRVVFGVNYSDGRDAVPAVRLSSGTRLFIGWIVLLKTISAPCILMIEEPENGLAPQAQALLWEKIQESSARGCQAIVASHSPFLLIKAWNTQDSEQVSILRCSVADGRASVRDLQSVIDEHQIQLRRTGGSRSELGLKQAEQLIEAAIYP